MSGSLCSKQEWGTLFSLRVTFPTGQCSGGHMGGGQGQRQSGKSSTGKCYLGAVSWFLSILFFLFQSLMRFKGTFQPGKNTQGLWGAGMLRGGIVWRVFPGAAREAWLVSFSCQSCSFPLPLFSFRHAAKTFYFFHVLMCFGAFIFLL